MRLPSAYGILESAALNYIKFMIRIDSILKDYAYPIKAFQNSKKAAIFMNIDI